MALYTAPGLNGQILAIDYENGIKSYLVRNASGSYDGVPKTEWDLLAYDNTENTIRLKSQGWTQAEIDVYFAQSNTDDDAYTAPDDAYTEDPITGGPVTYGDLRRRQDLLNYAEEQRLEDVRNDWRVRLHLGPEADYLYRDIEQMRMGSILAPLVETDGIIFPYTPQIAIQYSANYQNYDLTHSNYRGYFYTGSQVQNVLITATFTANDVREADYLLASLHFLRSCTKMFYGNDKQNGMPPPVVFLTGLGEYHFNNHPCAITMLTYNLPNDVDYIPCGKVNGVRDRNYSYETSSSPNARLLGIGKAPGGKTIKKSTQSESDNNGPVKIYNKATYVPTKIDLNFTMIPIQTREQISQKFSLAEYASGKLLKKGNW